MFNILEKLPWQAIKEAIHIIERNPIDKGVMIEQLRIIKRYADELEKAAKYEVVRENSSAAGCCGG
jgi:hypothetical protein